MLRINDRLSYGGVRFDAVRIFTGNATLRSNGSLIMGSGAARQLKDSCSGVEKEFGSLIRGVPGANLLFINTRNGSFGWFKTKQHWKSDSELGIIEKSCIELDLVSRANPDLQFLLNAPGIGCGGLQIEEVMPLLIQLPDNVHVYFYAR